jgi:multidrug efflux pump subunit AcrA (membrane-fusion protein)
MTPERVDSESPAKPGTLRGLLLAWVVAVALLATGGAIFAYLVNTPQKPSGQVEIEPGRLVRVLEAKTTSHRCRVRAFGTSRASREWTAIAETRGVALEVDPRFEPGEVLSAGTLLVRIDPEEFELAVERHQAEVRSQEEELKELDKTEANLKEIRDLQSSQLELSQKDLERDEALLKENVTTDAQEEATRNAYLSRLLAWQETTNSLSLISVKRERARALRDVFSTQLKQAHRELDNCQIRLPMDARCVSKSIEDQQYVGIGERLGVFLAMDTAEVVAMVETQKSATLFPRGVPGMESVDLTRPLSGESPFHKVLQHLDATIHWGSGKPWEGKVTRLASSLDRDTRTVGVVIEIPNPYADLVVGVRPPLIPDVFCEVTLYGATLDDVIVIPRDCLHEMSPEDLRGETLSVVYLLAGGERSEEVGPAGGVCFNGGHLKIQKVSVLSMEEDVVVIASGIEEGDLVVMGDLFPASDRMRLRGLLEVGPDARPEASL